jgi:hypothetical protein
MVTTRTTLTVDEELLDAARELGLNVSEAARNGIERAVWAERHRRALSQRDSIALPPLPPAVDELDADRRDHADDLARRTSRS